MQASTTDAPQNWRRAPKRKWNAGSCTLAETKKSVVGTSWKRTQRPENSVENGFTWGCIICRVHFPPYIGGAQTMNPFTLDHITKSSTAGRFAQVHWGVLMEYMVHTHLGWRNEKFMHASFALFQKSRGKDYQEIRVFQNARSHKEDEYCWISQISAMFLLFLFFINYFCFVSSSCLWFKLWFCDVKGQQQKNLISAPRV